MSVIMNFLRDMKRYWIEFVEEIKNDWKEHKQYYEESMKIGHIRAYNDLKNALIENGYDLDPTNKCFSKFRPCPHQFKYVNPDIKYERPGRYQVHRVLLIVSEDKRGLYIEMIGGLRNKSYFNEIGNNVLPGRRKFFLFDEMESIELREFDKYTLLKIKIRESEDSHEFEVRELDWTKGENGLSPLTDYKGFVEKIKPYCSDRYDIGQLRDDLFD